MDATFETEWDDVWERCETSYFCNGSKVFQEDYEPEDSEWIYDDFWEECQLTVNCLGEEIENVQQVEAEIEWEWDDFWEECVSNYITCDGTEVDGEISTDPYDIGDWTYTNAYCFRFITCLQGGNEFEQQIPSGYNNTGDQGDCPSGLVEVEFICDGEVISTSCQSSTQYPYTTNRNKKIENIKVQVLEKQLLIDLNKPTEKSMQVYLSDLLGRVSTSNSIDVGIKHLKINLNQPISGIYFINIISQGKLIHSQKVFIQN
ncbi:MAG: T9SS type A sorting domain-containing protein [Saprospiraceae bacterium]|nr:T9SS type A sorting domain-containing protein [Saprospiraceae bacterium]